MKKAEGDEVMPRNSKVDSTGEEATLSLRFTRKRARSDPELMLKVESDTEERPSSKDQDLEESDDENEESEENETLRNQEPMIRRTSSRISDKMLSPEAKGSRSTRSANRTNQSIDGSRVSGRSRGQGEPREKTNTRERGKTARCSSVDPSKNVRSSTMSLRLRRASLDPEPVLDNGSDSEEQLSAVSEDSDDKNEESEENETLRNQEPMTRRTSSRINDKIFSPEVKGGQSTRSANRMSSSIAGFRRCARSRRGTDGEEESSGMDRDGKEAAALGIKTRRGSLGAPAVERTHGERETRRRSAPPGDMRDNHATTARAQEAFSGLSANSAPPVGRRLDPQLRRQLGELLDAMESADTEGYFMNPVTEDIAPGYFDIVMNPMDISTVRNKLSRRLYDSVDAMATDLRLIYANCMLYNDDESEVFTEAQKQLEMLETLLVSL